jgi:histidinol-phosphate aminotransferase
MENIKQLVRKNILDLQAYSSARDEYKRKEGIFLDANENPFGTLNRYPDPKQLELKTMLSNLKKVNLNQIFVGNGSDEVIDLLIRIFCSPQKDKIIICPPTYGMYQVSAQINDVELIKIPLLNDFQLNTSEILKTEAKMLFLCSPNNPTGNSLDNIEYILEKFEGIVVVDEAYIDFSERVSFISKIEKYSNLVVSQTFSKAFGLASSRIGLAYSNSEIIGLINKVKPPYNVSYENQKAAISCLLNLTNVNSNIGLIKSERKRVELELKKLPIVTKLYPSDANFLLVEFQNANMVFKRLIEAQIITRNRTSEVSDCVRVTIGKPEENDKLLNEIKMIKK